VAPVKQAIAGYRALGFVNFNGVAVGANIVEADYQPHHHGSLQCLTGSITVSKFNVTKQCHALHH